MGAKIGILYNAPCYFNYNYYGKYVEMTGKIISDINRNAILFQTVYETYIQLDIDLIERINYLW